MVALFVEVGAEEGLLHTELAALAVVLGNLLSFQSAVRVVPRQPMLDPFAERIVIQIRRCATDGTVSDRDWVYQALVAHALRPEQTHVERRRLHML